MCVYNIQHTSSVRITICANPHLHVLAHEAAEQVEEEGRDEVPPRPAPEQGDGVAPELARDQAHLGRRVSPRNQGRNPKGAGRRGRRRCQRSVAGDGPVAVRAIRPRVSCGPRKAKGGRPPLPATDVRCGRRLQFLGPRARPPWSVCLFGELALSVTGSVGARGNNKKAVTETRSPWPHSSRASSPPATPAAGRGAGVTRAES